MLKYNALDMLLLASPFIIMDISTRLFGSSISFYPVFSITPRLFSLAYLILFIGISLNITKKDFIILFVGRLAEEKNIEFLLNNHLDLVRKHKNIKLVIVGDGPDAPKYRDFINEHHMEKNIIMTGKVPYDDMPSYYHIADVFTTASLSETQGLTVIEAMAASLTPVCIDDECFRNVITNNLNGKIFKNNEEYINSILELYNDHKILNDLSYNARLHSEVHSSKYYAERVIEVYKMTKRDPSTLRRIISRIKYKGEKSDE